MEPWHELLPTPRPRGMAELTRTLFQTSRLCSGSMAQQIQLQRPQDPLGNTRKKKLELEITEATSPAQQGVLTAWFLCYFILLLCDFWSVFPVRWTAHCGLPAAKGWLRLFNIRSSYRARSVSRERGTSSLGQRVARHFWWWIVPSAALQRVTELLNCLFAPQFPPLLWGCNLSHLVIVDRQSREADFTVTYFPKAGWEGGVCFGLGKRQRLLSEPIYLGLRFMRGKQRVVI